MSVINGALMEINCSLINRLKTMHALKKTGMRSAIWCYACLKLPWTFFDLGGKLQFSLDFNSALLSVNGSDIL